jgi:hypothetical protein
LGGKWLAVVGKTSKGRKLQERKLLVRECDATCGNGARVVRLWRGAKG